MLASLKYMLDQAFEKQYAVPHFVVWNAEMLTGVVSAAEAMHSPVIVSFGSGCLNNTDIDLFAPMFLETAKKATVPVAVHWDHGRNFEIVTHAYTLGFNALMIDASSNPLERNIELTKEVVDAFHPLGVPIEAELGHVGAETKYEDALSNYSYTDPKEAKIFVDETGIDCLAIAIGNMHGHYSSEPHIAFQILEDVRNLTDIPLVLHGGSGIGDDDIRHAISLGISKINVHTELCDAARNEINRIDSNEAFMALQQKVRGAIKQCAIEKITLFGSNDKA